MKMGPLRGDVTFWIEQSAYPDGIEREMHEWLKDSTEPDHREFDLLNLPVEEGEPLKVTVYDGLAERLRRIGPERPAAWRQAAYEAVAASFERRAPCLTLSDF